MYINAMITYFEKFMRLVEETNSCWIWKASPASRYGKYMIEKRYISAHRISWLFFVGTIPKGKYLCHTCDNMKCVNPAHLFLGSPRDNTQDMIRKGRNRKGESHGNSKLCDKDIFEIAYMYNEGYTKKHIAKKFKVSDVTIDNIIQRRIWTHIDILIKHGNNKFKLLSQIKGSKQHCAKLMENDVLEIRRLHEAGHTIKAISVLYQVTDGAISHIVHRRNWKHI